MLNFFQRLVGLDKSFAGLEIKAHTFHTTQTLQVETQAKLHDQMQVEMHVTRGLLSDVTSSAMNLQAAVDNTSVKIAHMVTLGGLSATVVQWSWLILVVFVVYQLSPRIARYATAAIGEPPTIFTSAKLCYINFLIHYYNRKLPGYTLG